MPTGANCSASTMPEGKVVWQPLEKVTPDPSSPKLWTTGINESVDKTTRAMVWPLEHLHQ
jgi:hypothetical protein